MNIDYLGDAKDGELTHQEIPYFSNIVRVGWPSPADDYVERSIDLNEYLILEYYKTRDHALKGKILLTYTPLVEYIAKKLAYNKFRK